ncbi:MAG: ATP-binding protein [Alloprevotella sp.]
MEREIMKDLARWRERKDRKPLILLGARQVGKTYILKEFGKRYYQHTAYINCDNNEMVRDLFAEDYDMNRILLTIGALTKTSILPGKTLIILDEIQELRRGLSALKYFCENAPEYHVVVAGSLLGITLHQGESYPVGKVNTLFMHPMTFEEFLEAKGDSIMSNLLAQQQWSVMSGLRSKYVQSLREYYFVGGMPEAVKKYVATNDTVQVREIQNEILLAYDKDISKHAPVAEAIRINQVWKSIPSQLAKENSKFIYGAVKKGARAKDFEVAIQWLLDAGLIYKVDRVRKPEIPLACYADPNAFKLYLLDCGLLGAMSLTPPAFMLMPNGMTQSKGSFTENFVCAQLHTISNAAIFYFSKDNSTQEVDFVVQCDAYLAALEVKAEENLQSKSLRAFHVDNPAVHCLRSSMADFKEQDWMTNIPLYAVRSYFSAPKAEALER